MIFKLIFKTKRYVNEKKSQYKINWRFFSDKYKLNDEILIFHRYTDVISNYKNKEDIVLFR